VLRVEHLSRPPRRQFDPLTSNVNPHAVERCTLPERLGERRPLIGRMVFTPDHPNGTCRIDLANTANSGCGGHATSDNEIGIVRHHFLL
jgi:hypothetical protein